MNKNQVNKLLNRHLETWSESDVEIRKALIQEIYTEDVEVVDPFSVIVGRQTLNNFITELQNKYPGYLFELSKDIDSHNHIARLNWRYGPPDNPDTITGQDIFVISAGRIERLFVFVDGLKNDHSQ